MVLSDSVILKEMEAGNIVIEPFDRKYLNPNSVDVTLAPECKVYANHFSRIDSEPSLQTILPSEPLDCRRENQTIGFTIPEEGFVLYPGILYLYAINERIAVKENVCATFMGKSSLGRLGLTVHVTAGFIDTGFHGSLVLEMTVVQPLRIYPNMKIGQLKFERVEGEILESYDVKPGSKYTGQVGVQASLMHKNFE